MDARTFALHALAFVLTYAIHSTLLLGLACLVASRIRSLAWREHLWKGAMLGGIVTAAVQAGMRLESPFAHWTLRPEPVAELRESAGQEPARPGEAASSGGFVADTIDGLLAAVRERSRVESDPVAAEPEASGPMLAEAVDGDPEPSFVVEDAPEDSAQVHSTADSGSDPADAPAAPILGAVEASGLSSVRAWLGHLLAHWREWTTTGLAAWAAFAAVVLAVFAGMWLRLARRLRGRVEVVDGDLRERLDRLVPLAFPRGRRVHLYVAPDVAAPVSFGFLRPSICVPPRAQTDLAPEERETMLAHELAHLARRDPLWLSAVWVIERVFFFQPLNRVARAELHDLAELACDTWAVTRTGHRLALASCLARIAEWIVGAPRALPETSMAATSMAEGHRSRLTQRIERLLADERLGDEGPRPWAAPVAASALACLVLVAPGVCAAAHEGRGVTQPDWEEEASEESDDVSDGGTPVPFEDDACASGGDDSAGSSPSDLEESLAGLDESVELLESELSSLRETIAQLEPDPRLERKLLLLELRVRLLGERRGQLRALVDAATAQPTPVPVFGP